MRILMIGTSVVSYFVNEAFAKQSTETSTR